ncbi:MAG: helix-turn-helix domain-containing protein [Alphaproteobacteria bacterium]|nr:helix-turn-helix domain-containing protein [Alphaproteobacteria bacterium]MBY0502025.1 helix-turn-helix domain-containing protein [Alphaproteobacteria bacterium]
MTFSPQSYKELSKMLVWHRKKSKITQQTLADLAGISRTAIQRLENGTAPVQLDTLWKVLEILNIKMSYSSPIMGRYKEHRMVNEK